MAFLTLEAVTRLHTAGREVRRVVDGVSLEVWPGDTVAIWGARRSGKTTLLRVIAGIEAPDAGTMRLDGADLGSLSASERTRRLRMIGYAPKEWRIAAGKPVLDHVALPLLADGRPLTTALAKAHEAMARVGATDCADASAHELTPADLTRVSLAQALAREPRVLLVDEPGATATPDERDALLRLLRGLADMRTDLAIVLTSRDVAGLGGASRVMSVGDGQLRVYEEPADIVPFPIRPRGAKPEPVS